MTSNYCHMTAGSAYDVQEPLLCLFFEQRDFCPYKVCVTLVGLMRLSLSLILNSYNFSQKTK